jgi:hypothetical protein
MGGSVIVARANAGGALGTWTSYPVGAWPLSIIAVDVNADGRADLVTANNLGGSHDGVSVLLGNGSGAFAAQPGQAAGPYPMGIGVADFDRDGKLDLVIADQGPLQGNSTAAVMLGQGDGSFTAPAMFEVGNFPESIAVGDLDGDGRPDIVVSNQLDQTTSILIASGDGTFAPQRRYPVTGSSLAIADVDGDGKPDVLVAAGSVAVLHAVGDGTFDATWSIPCKCGRIAIADVDRGWQTGPRRCRHRAERRDMGQPFERGDCALARPVASAPPRDVVAQPYSASICAAYFAAIGLRRSFIVGVSSSPPGSHSSASSA